MFFAVVTSVVFCFAKQKMNIFYKKYKKTDPLRLKGYLKSYQNISSLYRRACELQLSLMCFPVR